MTDRRSRRKAQQRARRGSWRGDISEPTNGADFDFDTFLRKTLAKHPLHLLSLTSHIIRRAAPDRYAFAKPDRREPLSLKNFIAGISGRSCRETTALLAVLAELLVDDEALQDRCREELAARTDKLPKWIVGLAQIDVYRAVRRTGVFGETDEIVIGARLADRSEFTIAVFLDHTLLSSVKHAGFRAEPIEKALAVAAEHIDADTTYVDMDLAEARAWMDHGIERTDRLPQPDWWLEVRPLVRWLTTRMLAGGTAHREPDWDEDTTARLVKTFLATPPGAPFKDVDYRDLLLELIDTGVGDPGRWSPARIETILDAWVPSWRADLPPEVLLDVPALLRAYVPFAHAQSGIREELTAVTLAVIDDGARRYKRKIMTAALEHDDEFGHDWAS